jgi:energy-coupling factor transporter ATP-binding protein EcfA2
VPARVRAAFVEEVLGLLELSAIADCQVGAASGGASGALAPGERKRLTIGVELVSNAPVIFLDEPTSGLDSRAAAVVMRVLHNIAATGRTIICTIHQPSADLFLKFDDLLLLQRGGWQVYLGPLGADGDAGDLKAYLATLPGARPCPDGMNPASWMLDVLGGTDSSAGAHLRAAAAKAAAKAAAAAAGADADKPAAAAGSGGPSALDGQMLQLSLRASTTWAAALQRMAPLCAPAPGATKVTFASARARSLAAQYAILVAAQWQSYNRNVAFNMGRISALTGLSIMFGIIW